MELYLTGPISRNPHALGQFKKTAEILRSSGYVVVNPFELDHPPEATWEQNLAVDLKAMMDVVLTGGELAIVDTRIPSRGMGLEIAVATVLGVKARPWIEYLENNIKP